jgi:hypothetical protein
MFALATPLSPQSAEWKPYTYPADGFQASFPALPEIQKKQVTTESGPLELRSYNVQLASAVLFIGVCDYGAAAAGKDPNAMLQGAKNGALLNSSSRLISEKAISLNGNPGLEYQARSDSALVTARIYMRGATIYQLIVVTPLGKPYSDAARFLDSFQFVERSTN